MTNRKYETTGVTRAHHDRELQQIRAIRAFGDVRLGDVGGWIEGDHNLSHEGTAWIQDQACVWGEATVGEDAIVCGSAEVYGHAFILGASRISDRAKVFEDARISGRVNVSGDAQVFGRTRLRGTIVTVGHRAKVCGESIVTAGAILGDAVVYENARVDGGVVDGASQVFGRAHIHHAKVTDRARVSGDTRVEHGACVGGDAQVYGSARISFKARVSGDAQVFGQATIYGEVVENAQVFDQADVGDTSKVSGSAKVYGSASLGSYYHTHTVGSEVTERARVHGGARICGGIIRGTAEVCGSALIAHPDIVSEGVTSEEPPQPKVPWKPW